MCGGCGADRGAADWARPFLAGLAARSAMANAVTSAVGRALGSGGSGGSGGGRSGVAAGVGGGPRVQARAGGWLVRSPTGAVTDCAGLGELVTAVGRWLGTPSDFAAGSPPSGRLLLPSPDARRGIRLRVDPSAAVRGLAEECETVVVPDDERALGVLAELSRPPWSARRYLTEVTVAGVTRAEVTRAGVTRAGVTGAAAGWAGVTGAAAGWAAAPTPVRAPSAAHAADLLLWLEHGRRSGRWDDAALAAHCPLEDTADGSGGAELYVEVRAGHVVRAGCRDHRSDLRV